MEFIFWQEPRHKDLIPAITDFLLRGKKVKAALTIKTCALALCSTFPLAGQIKG